MNISVNSSIVGSRFGIGGSLSLPSFAPRSIESKENVRPRERGSKMPLAASFAKVKDVVSLSSRAMKSSLVRLSYNMGKYKKAFNNTLKKIHAAIHNTKVLEKASAVTGGDLSSLKSNITNAMSEVGDHLSLVSVNSAANDDAVMGASLARLDILIDEAENGAETPIDIAQADLQAIRDGMTSDSSLMSQIDDQLAGMIGYLDDVDPDDLTKNSLSRFFQESKSVLKALKKVSRKHSDFQEAKAIRRELQDVREDLRGAIRNQTEDTDEHAGLVGEDFGAESIVSGLQKMEMMLKVAQHSMGRRVKFDRENLQRSAIRQIVSSERLIAKTDFLSPYEKKPPKVPSEVLAQINNKFFNIDGLRNFIAHNIGDFL